MTVLLRLRNASWISSKFSLLRYKNRLRLISLARFYYKTALLSPLKVTRLKNRVPDGGILRLRVKLSKNNRHDIWWGRRAVDFFEAQTSHKHGGRGHTRTRPDEFTATCTGVL